MQAYASSESLALVGRPSERSAWKKGKKCRSSVSIFVKTTTWPTGKEIGRAVYETLVGVGVPKNDRLQVIGEHGAIE
jgi:hypothetical protein